MSGRDTVRQMRESGALQQRSSSGLGFAALLVVLFAGSAGAFFGVKALMPAAAQSTTAPQVVVAGVVPVATPVWTEQDDFICRNAMKEARKADAARVKRELADGGMMPATAAGMAQAGALVLCHASVKPERLCDLEQRVAFVATVRGYLDELMIQSAFLGASKVSLNGPISLMMGDQTGPVEIVGDGLDRTGQEFVRVHRRVVAKLRELAEQGLVTDADFGVLMGIGVPDQLKPAFANVKVTAPACR